MKAMKSKVLVLIAMSAIALTSVHLDAATVTLTTSDAVGSASFNSAGHWSSGAAPVAGNDYVVAGVELRTVQDGTNYTFAGDSLTVSGAAGYLSYKGLGTTITVNNLNLDGGSVLNKSTGVTFTLAGNLRVLSGGGIIDNVSANSTIVVSSNLSGSGALQFRDSANASGPNQVTRLTGNNSSYTGAISVGQYTTLDVRTDGGLGTGNVSIAGAAALTLQSGATNNYIGDGALLTLNATSLLTLNFTGTDTIGALTLDGGTTFAQIGTWGAIGSSATYQSSLITGTGILNVTAVPEAGTESLLVLSMGLWVLASTRKLRLHA